MSSIPQLQTARVVGDPEPLPFRPSRDLGSAMGKATTLQRRIGKRWTFKPSVVCTLGTLTWRTNDSGSKSGEAKSQRI